MEEVFFCAGGPVTNHVTTSTWQILSSFNHDDDDDAFFFINFNNRDDAIIYYLCIPFCEEPHSRALCFQNETEKGKGRRRRKPFIDQINHQRLTIRWWIVGGW